MDALQEAISSGKPLMIRMAEADGKVFIRVYDTDAHSLTKEDGSAVTAYSLGTIIVGQTMKTKMVNSLVKLVSRFMGKGE